MEDRESEKLVEYKTGGHDTNRNKTNKIIDNLGDE